MFQYVYCWLIPYIAIWHFICLLLSIVKYFGGLSESAGEDVEHEAVFGGLFGQVVGFLLVGGY